MFVQILCLFCCPLIGTFIFEKVNQKDFNRKERLFVYVLMVIIVNVLCMAAIILISKNGSFVLGNPNQYTARFVFKYLLTSFFFSCIACPYGFLLWKRRKAIASDLYKKTEVRLTGMANAYKEYSTEHKGECILTWITFAVFLFLMVYKLMNSALWGDELVEFVISSKSILNGDMYKSVISTYQPPLYNWLMHFWLLIDNQSILWFRLFNVVLGMVSGVFLFFAQVKLFKNRILACMSLIVLGICYRWIYVVQECSEYALMLTSLFAAIYFYISYKEDNKFRDEILFVLSCVAAMYSQYGAAFIVGPLLIIHLIDVLRTEKDLMLKFRTCLFYFFSLMFFAMPLYFKYLKIQMENNRIAAYANLGINIKELGGVLTQFGLNVGYLWNLNSIEFLKIVLSYAWIPFILVFLLVGIKKHNGTALVNLVLTLIVGYIAHYFLVVMHIYAMIHPNESSGFYSRYSYFYIPILAVLLPGGIYAIVNALMPRFSRAKILVAYVAVIVLFATCWPAINQNWHKASDDLYAKYWVENGGYKEPTYLSGACCWDAFKWYVTKPYGKSYGNNVHDASEIDLRNLPETFWLWRTNWSGEIYDTILNAAIEQGYDIQEIYHGGLARLKNPNVPNPAAMSED